MTHSASPTPPARTEPLSSLVLPCYDLYLYSPSTPPLVATVPPATSPNSSTSETWDSLPSLCTTSGILRFPFLLPHQISSAVTTLCPLSPAHGPSLSAPPASFPSLTCLDFTVTISHRLSSAPPFSHTGCPRALALLKPT